MFSRVLPVIRMKKEGIVSEIIVHYITVIQMNERIPRGYFFNFGKIAENNGVEIGSVKIQQFFHRFFVVTQRPTTIINIYIVLV